MAGSTWLAGLIVLALLVVAAVGYWGRKNKFLVMSDANLQLYDYPQLYPHFVRPARWDSDKKCSAYCSSSKCAVWCR